MVVVEERDLEEPLVSLLLDVWNHICRGRLYVETDPVVRDPWSYPSE